MATVTLEPEAAHGARATDGPDAPTPTPGRRGRLRKLLVGVGLVVVLAAGVALRLDLVPGLGSGDDAAPATVEQAPPATPAPPPDPAQQALDAAVQELQQFVAEQRQLEFLRPVRAVRLTDAELVETFAEQHELDEAEIENLRQAERILKTLGLVTPEYDLVQRVSDPSALAAGILGWYDSDTEVLYVRGDDVSPMVRSVIVHELVHALDDQHFDLGRLVGVGGDLEEDIAARALVEGNAQRVEDAYIEQLSPEERAAIEAERDANLVEDGLEAFEVADYFQAFPYVDGPGFVQALLDRGGEREVDAAFARPPRTTAEVLEPDRYLHGLSGARLSPPATGSDAVDSGMFGELGLFLLVADAVGPEDAAVAAAPWEGDSYVAYEDGDRMCVKVRFLLEDPWTTELTADILSAWAAKQIDASVSALGTVTVTSCR